MGITWPRVPCTIGALAAHLAFYTIQRPILFGRDAAPDRYDRRDPVIAAAAAAAAAAAVVLWEEGCCSNTDRRLGCFDWWTSR